MIAAVDAYYADNTASVACVTFDAWADACARRELTTEVTEIAAYAPGEFWRRELPCILRVLSLLDAKPDVVVVDGYVWLDPNGRMGLGAHLFEALERKVAVVGVAKTAYREHAQCALVRRGESARPLYVSSAGMSLAEAASAVASMHGEYRIPSLLKRVDQLSRGVAS